MSISRNPPGSALNDESLLTCSLQAPTKYEPAINLKTAKGLGLTVPPALPPPPTR
jgi:hypothetical protein